MAFPKSRVGTHELKYDITMSKKKNNNKSNLSLSNITALNDKQKRVLQSNNNLVLTGSAGTGKTFLASWIGFNELLKDNFDRVLYIRSAVPTRDIGFLPGNEKEKMQVYTKPYVDICSELFSCGTAYYSLEREGRIGFEPTSFVRGRTYKNSFIIVDECQNMTFHELDSLITRLDDDSRIVFCGDTRQADLGKNGFDSFFKIINSMSEFDSVKFDIEDVVRGGIVKNYLERKERYYSG